MDDDGFYMGEIDGVRGLVPSNFLADAQEQYAQTGQMSTMQGQYAFIFLYLPFFIEFFKITTHLIFKSTQYTEFKNMI